MNPSVQSTTRAARPLAPAPHEDPVAGPAIDPPPTTRRGNGDGVRRPRAGRVPADAADLIAWEAIAENSALVNHFYGGALPAGWEVAADLTNDVKARTGLGHVGENFISRKRNGFNCEILRNAARNEVVVSFPGATAGARPGQGLVRRGFANKRMTTVQLATVLKSRFAIPTGYEHAARVLDTVLHLTGPTKPVVRIVAHSKGGQEGMYANLRRDRPVEVDAFSAPDLSKRVVAKAGFAPERLAEAREVDHVVGFVDGDYVTRRPFTSLWSGETSGRRFSIPASDAVRSGPLNRHGDFDAHVRAAFASARQRAADAAAGGEDGSDAT